MKMMQAFDCYEDDVATEFAEFVGGTMEYKQFEVIVRWNGRPSDLDEFRSECGYSATRGDYSPSSPWNAPGMSVSDFI